MSRRATAFYTPKAVALRLAAELRLRRPAVVIDPACGDGQLLAAIMRRRVGVGLTLVGVDTNRRAVLACRKRLRSCGAASVRLYHGDFFALANRIARENPGERYVLMNPPFIAYKRLSPRERRRLRTLAPGLTGRFNVADAFVLTALSELVPRSMIAILPASTGARLSANGQLSGRRIWRRLPDSTFAATISTGAMLWRRRATAKPSADWPRPSNHLPRARLTTTEVPVVVRNGVATGADGIFLKMGAAKACTGGRVLRCVRGRDVAREKRLGDLPKIWAPTSTSADGTATLKREDIDRLRARYCVRVKKKPVSAYHSTIPRWFLGQPKLIVPEICRTLTLFDDRQGRVLPLHSTLAIKANSLRTHGLVKDLLLRSQTWTQLRRTSEVMVGGAIRLTAGGLTNMILRGLAESAK
jgi:hypothetical protein